MFDIARFFLTEVFALVRLVCAVAFKNRLERFGDQLDVGAEVPVAHILVVQAHPFFKADVAAPADLPEARQARRYGKPHLVPGKVFLDFGRKRRAGAHNGHVASQDVEKLRQFVQAEFAENASHRVNPGVVFHFERRAAGLVEFSSSFLKKELFLFSLKKKGACENA